MVVKQNFFDLNCRNNLIRTYHMSPYALYSRNHFKIERIILVTAQSSNNTLIKIVIIIKFRAHKKSYNFNVRRFKVSASLKMSVLFFSSLMKAFKEFLLSNSEIIMFLIKFRCCIRHWIFLLIKFSELFGKTSNKTVDRLFK